MKNWDFVEFAFSGKRSRRRTVVTPLLLGMGLYEAPILQSLLILIVVIAIVISFSNP